MTCPTDACPLRRAAEFHDRSRPDGEPGNTTPRRCCWDARNDADAGMGVELLPARDPRRGYGGIGRRAAGVGVWCFLRGAPPNRGPRSVGGPHDRSPRRTRRPRRFQHRVCDRASCPGREQRDDGPMRGLDRLGHRNGARALRRCFCDARRDLWPRRARTHNRYHVDRGFRVHGRLAALGISRCGIRLARSVSGVGGDAYCDRPAAQSASRAARLAPNKRRQAGSHGGK